MPGHTVTQMNEYSSWSRRSWELKATPGFPLGPGEISVGSLAMILLPTDSYTDRRICAILVPLFCPSGVSSIPRVRVVFAQSTIVDRPLSGWV